LACQTGNKEIKEREPLLLLPSSKGLSNVLFHAGLETNNRWQHDSQHEMKVWAYEYGTT
jgi:hypothetical protein